MQITLGNIAYEITNYLGNVNAVISDRKTWVSTVSAFKAVVLSKTDYFPFGMEISSRTVSTQEYRYGYNGMFNDTWFSGTESLSGINLEWSFSGTSGEQDNETKGEGNSYTTEFRQYDPRLGRWLSLDPLMAQYPMMSPYVAFNNNPIYFVDPLGLEGVAPGKPGRTWKDENGIRHKWKKGDIYIDKDGNEHKFLGKSRNRSFEDSWEITKGKVQDLPEITCRPKQESSNKVVNDIKTILEKNLQNSSNSKGAYGGVVIHTENGKTFEQVDPVTIIVWGGGQAEFRFIYPSDLGTTRTPGSDGLYWKGCMSCHSPIGAYNYAAMNSRERIQGIVISSVITMFAPGAIGATSNAAKTSSSIFSYITPKITKQMASRGWTNELIHNTVNSPFTTRAATNRATGNAATAYFQKNGSYVVKDNVTNQVIQISNRLDPKWIPDATIINPYIPK